MGQQMNKVDLNERTVERASFEEASQLCKSSELNSMKMPKKPLYVTNRQSFGQLKPKNLSYSLPRTNEATSPTLRKIHDKSVTDTMKLFPAAGLLDNIYAEQINTAEETGVVLTEGHTTLSSSLSAPSLAIDVQRDAKLMTSVSRDGVEAPTTIEPDGDCFGFDERTPIQRYITLKPHEIMGPSQTYNRYLKVRELFVC
jgi:hypothetical protein